MPVYLDPETAQPIVTHSMLKTFSRCPKQAEFKYAMRLKPKRHGKPLKRGTWLHKLLEVHYNGEDWREEHAKLSAQFDKLMDEEKDHYGDLPRECARIMKGYLWHYKDDPWKVLEVEFVLEVTLPDGTLYRAKIDLLVENQYGLWIVDHKSHKTLPGLDFRLLDAQSALYIWAAIKNKIPVQGHIWNYLRTKAPTIPELLKDGSRLSRRRIETDYVTLATAIKRYGLDPTPYAAQLRALKAYQHRPGEPQLSPFFRRDVLEKSPAMLSRVAKASYHTAKRINDYPFDKPDIVERVVDRSCLFMCSYTDICTLQLFGGNIAPLLRQRYDVGDPMDYYWDQDSQEERKGEE
jgi:hypothetical protein